MRCTWVAGLAVLAFGSAARAEDAATAPAPAPADVQVESQSPVLVEHRDTTSGEWSHVCASPCSFVPLGGEYRVLGTGVAPSEPFALSGPGKLTVDAGSVRKKNYGLAIMGAGAGSLLLGVILLASSAAFVDPTPAGMIREEKIGLLVSGTIFTFLGAGAGAFGGAMYLDNRESRVFGPLMDVRPRGAGFTVPLVFAF